MNEVTKGLTRKLWYTNARGSHDSTSVHGSPFSPRFSAPLQHASNQYTCQYPIGDDASKCAEDEIRGEEKKNARLEGGSAEARARAREARAAAGAVGGPRQRERAERQEEEERSARQQQRRHDRRRRPPAPLPATASAAAQQRPPAPPRHAACHAHRQVTSTRSALSPSLPLPLRPLPPVVLAASPPLSCVCLT